MRMCYTYICLIIHQCVCVYPEYLISNIKVISQPNLMEFIVQLGHVKTQGILNTVNFNLRNSCGHGIILYFDYSGDTQTYTCVKMA